MYIKDFDIDIELDDLQMAIYKQGKKDMLEEIRSQTKDSLITQMLFGILINKSPKEIEQLRKEIEKGQK